jgi:hypothetical protein
VSTSNRRLAGRRERGIDRQAAEVAEAKGRRREEHRPEEAGEWEGRGTLWVWAMGRRGSGRRGAGE